MWALWPLPRKTDPENSLHRSRSWTQGSPARPRFLPMRWREAFWAGLRKAVTGQVLAPPPRVLPVNIRTQPSPCQPPAASLPPRGQPDQRGPIA